MMTAHLIAAVILTPTDSATVVAALAGCLIVYLAYKLFYRPDFGMPVRRRLLARHVRIRRDQFAVVPMWWSDLQIQRAISGHWKQSLRDNVTRPVGSGAELTGRPSEMGARAATGVEGSRAGR
jgi:hypothetical protein